MEGLLLDRGPHKLMRRIAMLILVVAIPLILRGSGWEGLRDMGWGRGFDRRSFLRGVRVGLISLGVLALLTFLLHYRVVDSKLRHPGIELRLLGYVFSALVVGVLEETLTRGVLFRSLSKVWGVVWTAWVTSLFFALAHFMEPQAAAFSHGPFMETVMAVLNSMTHPLFAGGFVGLQIMNLTLMSVALCVMVVRTDTIWLAAGLHAGWVYIKLANSSVMDMNPEAPHLIWLGQRPDNLDSLAATLMLLLVMVWGIRQRRAS